jgi:hypothetical protein
MQMKGFFWGATVASVAWLGTSAIAERGAPMHGVVVLEAAAAHGMTAEEQEAHVAEMRQLWRDMTPAQRDAHRNMARCPYSGQAGGGAHGQGQTGKWEKGARQAREPLEI